MNVITICKSLSKCTMPWNFVCAASHLDTNSWMPLHYMLLVWIAARVDLLLLLFMLQLLLLLLILQHCGHRATLMHCWYFIVAVWPDCSGHSARAALALSPAPVTPPVTVQRPELFQQRRIRLQQVGHVLLGNA
jgi:hypothetical protein